MPQEPTWPVSPWSLNTRKYLRTWATRKGQHQKQVTAFLEHKHDCSICIQKSVMRPVQMALQMRLGLRLL